MAQDQRAPREEVFDFLRRRLGPEAEVVIAEAVGHFQAGEMDQGLAVLKDFDAEIGGVGLHKQGDEKLPGPYRPLTYVYMILKDKNPEQLTRFAVHVSCAYIEGVLKQMARLGFFERARADRLPLGAILRKVKKPMPPDLYEDLCWLSDGVCNYAKHHFGSYSADEDSVSAHLFALDEAIALYLIARALVVAMETHFHLFESGS